MALVEQWLKLRGEAPGPLLFPIRKGGEIQFRRMTDDGVLKILQRRAFLAGVDSFSPHDFRRTFCSDLLDAGVDIVTVQKLAGHASPVTTAFVRSPGRRNETTGPAALRVLILRVESSSQIFLRVSQFTLIRLSCTFLKMAVVERFRLNFSLESVLAFDRTDKLTGFAVIVPEKNDL